MEKKVSTENVVLKEIKMDDQKVLEETLTPALGGVCGIGCGGAICGFWC